ncbi:MAG: hypothetical protein KIT08_07560 [Anaerolineales bacterium]|nr:MAG: hypothetical protein KIT08_07560 [Anaerolineales bacterium]
MLDDFLREDDTESFLNEIQETPTLIQTEDDETGFLGMTPLQRFVISVMFFFMVLIIGAFCLLITGSIAIPLG